MFKFYFMYFPSKSGSIVLFVYLFICFFFLQGVLSVEVFFFDFHVDVVGLQGHRSSIMWHGSSATLFSPAEDFPEVAPSNGFVGYCGFRPYPKWWLDLTFRQDYPLLHWDALYEGMVAPHKAGYEYKIWPVSEAAGLSLPGPVAETAREVHPMNPELESALQNYRDFLRRFAIMGLWPSWAESCLPVSGSEIVDYQEVKFYVLDPKSTDDYPYIRMYNNSFIKADPKIIDGITFMETAEAPLDTHNPLTKMRARQMVEEETRLGGKFIQESPKTFAEKGWGDWYNDHRVFFRLIAFAAGCYMGYRWYRSQNPSDFAPSWDSSDLH